MQALGTLRARFPLHGRHLAKSGQQCAKGPVDIVRSQFRGVHLLHPQSSAVEAGFQRPVLDRTTDLDLGEGKGLECFATWADQDAFSSKPLAASIQNSCP